jgi:hypothetical protein
MWTTLEGKMPVIDEKFVLYAVGAFTHPATGQQVFLPQNETGAFAIRKSGSLAWFTSEANARSKCAERTDLRAKMLSTEQLLASLRGDLVAHAVAETKPVEIKPAVLTITLPPPVVRPAPAPTPLPAEVSDKIAVYAWTDGTVRDVQGTVVGDMRVPKPEGDVHYVRGFWKRSKQAR